MTRIICWPSQYPPWVVFVWLDYTRGISIGIFSIFHNALDLNRSKRKCNATLKRVLTKTHIYLNSTPYNNSHLYCWPFPLFIASAAVLSWSPDIILSCGAACTCSMPRGKHFFPPLDHWIFVSPMCKRLGLAMTLFIEIGKGWLTKK